MERYKIISCKHTVDGVTCGTTCYSGKKGLCDKHYAEYIKSRSKSKDKDKKTTISPVSKDKFSMSNLQLLYQKFARLSGGDYCASCGIGSADCGGHLIAKGKSKHVAILLSNIYPQCNNCNSPQGLNGNPKGLMKAGFSFWGKPIMQELINLSMTNYTFNEKERKDLHEKVTEALNLLEDAVSDFEKDALRRKLFAWQREQHWYTN